MTQKTFADLRIGDTLRNNDKRAKGCEKETITITDIVRGGVNPCVVYRAATREATIKQSRIFFDGKSRAQGYNYVEPVTEAQALTLDKPSFKVGDRVVVLPSAVKACSFPHRHTGVVGELVAIDSSGFYVLVPTSTSKWWINDAKHLEAAASTSLDEPNGDGLGGVSGE